MITIPELQAIADTGMLVVLWMVQLVIYPSFLRIEDAQLQSWHRDYTFRVSFVIMPLMLLQLGCAIFHTVQEEEFLDYLVMALVLICWALTFFISVPLHQKIEQGDLAQNLRHRLIATNWPRTICWSLIFILGLRS